MKVSELIEELKKAMKDVGDVDAAIINDGDIHSFEVNVVVGYDYGDRIKYLDDDSNDEFDDDDEFEDGDAPIIIGIADY